MASKIARPTSAKGGGLRIARLRTLFEVRFADAEAAELRQIALFAADGKTKGLTDAVHEIWGGVQAHDYAIWEAFWPPLSGIFDCARVYSGKHALGEACSQLVGGPCVNDGDCRSATATY